MVFRTTHAYKSSILGHCCSQFQLRTSLSTYSITSRKFSILSHLAIDASYQDEAIVFKWLAYLPSCHGRQVGIIVGGRALAARGPGFDFQQCHLSFVTCSNIVISKAHKQWRLFILLDWTEVNYAVSIHSDRNTVLAMSSACTIFDKTVDTIIDITYSLLLTTPSSALHLHTSIP